MALIDKLYIDGMKNILVTGVNQEDRTSIGSSRQAFFNHIHFKTQGKYIPFVQCRSFSPRIAFEEWIWMMSGSTDSKILEEKNVNIWKGNTTREFLDSRGLVHLPEGDIGRSYGYQFRNFGGQIDQVEKVFNSLKNNPTSRRHVISIWNPIELDLAPLEPCCHLYEFMVVDGRLNLYQHMRSADWLLGVPYNLGFGGFWLHAFAKALGFETGDHVLTATNAHIYKNGIEVAFDMLLNASIDKPDPRIEINKDLSSLDDILKLKWEDIIVSDWKRGKDYGKIEMAV